MASQPSPTIIAATIAELRPHAPFDRMDDGALTRLVAALTLRYFAQGSVILSPQDGVITRLLIVQRGQVHGETDSAAATERRLALSEGEMFPETFRPRIRRGVAQWRRLNQSRRAPDRAGQSATG